MTHQFNQFPSIKHQIHESRTLNNKTNKMKKKAHRKVLPNFPTWNRTSANHQAISSDNFHSNLFKSVLLTSTSAIQDTVMPQCSIQHSGKREMGKASGCSERWRAQTPNIFFCVMVTSEQRRLHCSYLSVGEVVKGKTSRRYFIENDREEDREREIATRVR